MSRRTLILLTLLVAVTPFISPFQRNLFVGDETKYGQVIWEMRESGSLLVPQLEGRPYTHKPPIHFWMIWALTWVFGTESIWPFVIPSLAGFLVLLWLVGRLAAELFGAHEWLSRFILASFWLVWGLAQTARMDIGFTAAITAAALLFWRWLESDSSLELNLAAVLIGIAILIKGPMAAVIMMVLFITEVVRRRKRWRGSWWMALMIAAAIPFAWVIPATMAGGEEYSRELLIDQNVGRAVSSWTHAAPPWFYLLRYPVTFLPWSLVSIPAILAIWKRRGEEDSKGSLRFCFTWVLAVIAPFSLLSGKLDVYMVPAMVPIALLTARYLGSDRRDALEAWGIRLSRGLLIVFALLFPLAITLAPRFVDDPAEGAMLELPVIRGLFWLTGGAALAGLALQLAHPNRNALRSAVIAALVTLVPLSYIVTALMPVANDEVSSEPLVRVLAEQTLDGREVGLHGTPHLWAPDLPRSLRTARFLGAGALRDPAGEAPRILATRRDRADQLGPGLAGYRRVGEVTLKGKEIDVYRRD
ncbi:MAG TPA: glycosyltransferase family 39 protein [Thermoanaerobaculia bacterium]|nr:glycosyltransferase family 39 protein [Thermoanaerobaculia bacterium]